MTRAARGPAPELKTRTFVRMDETLYKELERTCPQPSVSEGTSAHQAGFLLGIQFVLRKLREGYVISQ